jgi:hypothetical protein
LEIIYMQQKLRILAASVAAVAFASIVSTGSAAGAAPEKPSATDLRAITAPAKANSGGVSTQSASSGASSADFTGDGRPDILARQADNGVLKVYPHSGTFNGAATYRSAVTINYGWGGLRWIGTGLVNSDYLGDVLAIGYDGVLNLYPHSGNFNGTGTLSNSVVLGYGWDINDLVLLGDFTGDGYSDIMARRTGGDILYLYPHSGVVNGVNTYLAPVPIVNGVRNTVELNFGDFTRDGFPDLMYLEPASTIGVFSFVDGPTDPNGNPTGWAWDIGYGWDIMNGVGLTDVNSDGAPDVLGRRHNGELYVYPHTGNFNPQAPTITLTSPTYLGAGWNTNNVIS